jgi:hypothetical protein
VAALAAPLLGAALFGGGLVLLYQRVRTEGLARLWPLVLVALGFAGVGLGSVERDDAWWLIDTGSTLLFNTLASAATHLLMPFTAAASGFVALRATLLQSVPMPRGESHVE